MLGFSGGGGGGAQTAPHPSQHPSPTHRLQLRDVPVQVLGHPHHLGDDPIHLLGGECQRGGGLGRSPPCPVLTELSRSPFPSLSYSLKVTAGGHTAV